MKTVFDQIKDMDAPELATMLLQFFEAGKYDGNLQDILGDMPIMKWMESTDDIYLDVPDYLMRRN